MFVAGCNHSNCSSGGGLRPCRHLITSAVLLCGEMICNVVFCSVVFCGVLYYSGVYKPTEKDF